MKKINNTSGNVVCGNCGVKYNYKDVVVDRIEHIETERERICNSCNNVIDYWCYGSWESNFK